MFYKPALTYNLLKFIDKSKIDMTKSKNSL